LTVATRFRDCSFADTQLMSAQSLGRGVTPSRVADDEGGSQVVRVSATLTVPEAARLLGIGRNLAYEIAARDGEIAGVTVIRVGRRLLIPLARLLEVLGLHDDSTRFEPKR
jgi:excisionase family DNA binding protein